MTVPSFEFPLQHSMVEVCGLDRDGRKTKALRNEGFED
jgi:hypothetical protein